MDKNYEIIQDILTKAIQITVTQKQDVSWEFYPLSKVLSISISFNGKCSKGLVKTYGVKVEDTECLKIIQKELMSIQANNLEDDFLGD
ncbi:hypothetical protein [Clostridium sporogenes]|uniref:hypothetical protein n=1 Tax=Clostridium sporogenes TaxID=1509 RepID=UPI0013D42B0E|nr:hypothetical protein [Clostridium sporogenes]NFF78357.1 hypothetical protein [Clostridium sporogenes]NFU88878.1 hypothetical protein [Clostridium sporogenes]